MESYSHQGKPFIKLSCLFSQVYLRQDPNWNTLEINSPSFESSLIISHYFVSCDETFLASFYWIQIPQCQAWSTSHFLPCSFPRLFFIPALIYRSRIWRPAKESHLPKNTQLTKRWQSRHLSSCLSLKPGVWKLHPMEPPEIFRSPWWRAGGERVGLSQRLPLAAAPTRVACVPSALLLYVGWMHKSHSRTVSMLRNKFGSQGFTSPSSLFRQESWEPEK